MTKGTITNNIPAVANPHFLGSQDAGQDLSPGHQNADLRGLTEGESSRHRILGPMKNYRVPYTMNGWRNESKFGKFVRTLNISKLLLRWTITGIHWGCESSGIPSAVHVWNRRTWILRVSSPMDGLWWFMGIKWWEPYIYVMKWLVYGGLPLRNQTWRQQEKPPLTSSIRWNLHGAGDFSGASSPTRISGGVATSHMPSKISASVL